MSLNHGPSIATSGLTLYLDAANIKSYPGTGSTWFDLSGLGNNGTLVNSPSWTTVGGVRTFSFNGTNNRVSFSYQTPVQSASATAFTWGVWLRANRNFDGDLVMGNRGTTPLQFYKMTTQKFEMYPAEIFSPVPLATWIYVTGVWNGLQSGASNLKTYMYVNGVQVGSRDGDTPDFSPNPMTFNIGGDVAANEWFQGSIAAAHVYNRALSAAEVTQNFRALRGRYGI
jgi:hypothetical protein